MSKENATAMERIFGSKTRAKLLELFFSNTNKSFYVREITRVIEEQINSVRRELTNLEAAGIVKNETFDNKIYYSANMRHPYSKALKDLFNSHGDVNEDRGVKKNVWEEYCKSVSKYLSGLIVTNRKVGQDGVDLLIIGNDKTKKLTRWAEVVEKRVGKPLNYVIMSEEDFAYRKSVRDRFIADIMEMEIAEIYDPEKIIK
ncbi:MAG: transcriptional regulator [Candidatus Saccharibacteria bacterium]|nr:transcriptional regulator [Candidatus Saccharibacteria bacterium]